MWQSLARQKPLGVTFSGVALLGTLFLSWILLGWVIERFRVSPFLILTKLRGKLLVIEISHEISRRSASPNLFLEK